MSGGSADIRVGDIVQRGNGDRHVVTESNWEPGALADLVHTRCIQSDEPYVSGDGKRSEIIWRVGDEDFFCADDVELIERPADPIGGMTPSARIPDQPPLS